MNVTLRASAESEAAHEKPRQIRKGRTRRWGFSQDPANHPSLLDGHFSFVKIIRDLDESTPASALGNPPPGRSPHRCHHSRRV